MLENQRDFHDFPPKSPIGAYRRVVSVCFFFQGFPPITISVSDYITDYNPPRCGGLQITVPASFIDYRLQFWIAILKDFGSIWTIL